MNELTTSISRFSLAGTATISIVARGLNRLADLPKNDVDFEMGHNYWEGKNGYEQNDDLAMKHFRKSVSKNNYEAMCDLAMLESYHPECGCYGHSHHQCGLDESAQLNLWEKSMKQSVNWLHKAALANYPRAQCELPGSWCYCDGETECGEISCRLDKSGWLEKAAAQGYPPAFTKLAIEKRPERAVYFFDKLEQLDESRPEFAGEISALAMRFITGRGVTKNISKGLDLHTRAGELGYRPSQMALAEHFSEGKVCVPDYEKAFFWCGKACESGNAFALLLLANFYENGRGTPINLAKSIECLKKFVTESPESSKAQLAFKKINQLEHLFWHDNH